MIHAPMAAIVGHGRSGTSILGEVVGAHIDVSYVFEAAGVWKSAGLLKRRNHLILPSDLTSDQRAKMRNWSFKAIGDKRLLVDKEPRLTFKMPMWKSIFPDCRIVHIIRNPLDVLCSVAPMNPRKEWNTLKDMIAFGKKDSVMMRNAKVWRFQMTMARRQMGDHLEVRFEDLVQDPIGTARGVLDYLGLMMTENTQRICDKIQDKTDGSYHAKQQSKWFRNNHKARVGRWASEISKKEYDRIIPILCPLMQEYGYE